MNLGQALLKVANEFVFERGKQFSGNSLAQFIRQDLVKFAENAILYRDDKYKIKGSAGAGNWAAVPWLGFFDPIITETAQSGFYVVFLINAQSGDVYLSLNQGTTETYREYGEPKGREVLRRRAEDTRQRLSEKLGQFDLADIDLGSTESLPLGYQAGHAFGYCFKNRDLHQANLEEKLSSILDAYQLLITRGGLIPTDIMFEQSGSKNIEETRRYVLSKRIERSPSVRRDVLSMSELVCQGCGLNPKIDYGYDGPPINTPLDVHHLTVLRELAEGETRRYRVPDDFAVLCPTCHRMIHKQKDASDTSQLRNSVRFRHMREVF